MISVPNDICENVHETVRAAISVEVERSLPVTEEWLQSVGVAPNGRFRFYIENLTDVCVYETTIGKVKNRGDVLDLIHIAEAGRV
jgi:hypothetical protein